MFGRKKKKFKRHYKKQARRKFFQKTFFWKIVIIFILLGGLIYLFLFSPLFEVQQIQIEGQIKIEPQKIREYVNQNLDSRLSKSLLTSFSSLEKKLPRQLNLLKKVEIKKDFSHSLIIKLEERKAFFRVNQNNECFVVDKEGIVLDIQQKESVASSAVTSSSATSSVAQVNSTNNTNNNNFQTKNLFLIKSSLKNLPDLGNLVFEEEKWLKLFSLWKDLSDLSLIAPLQKIVIPKWEKVTFITDQGVELYFNINREKDWQITKLKTILKQKKDSEFAALNYVDLRYDNYIFTKDHPKEEEN